MTIKEYNELVESQADPLYRFLLKSSKDTSVAEDLVQESFARVWENLRNVEVSKSKSYLFTIGYRCVIDYFRKQKSNRLMMEDLAHSNYSFEMNTDKHQLSDLINLALDQIPVTQKTILLLRDYEGYDYQEISDMTKLSMSQVKVYIFRARKALRDLLLAQKDQLL